jgi:hypothetical protein
MGEICSKQCGESYAYKILARKCHAKRRFGNTGGNGTIFLLLKWIFGKGNVKV